jgi:PIN domain nuclease of toxin-antitoxin system
LTSLPPTIEPVYVVDTHALIWYLTLNKRLSPFADQVFEAAERNETQIVISVIVLAELFYANKKWKLSLDFATVLSDLKNKSAYRIVPLQPHDILDFDQDAAVPEMHDRIIAGLARRLSAPLLTSDAAIVAAGIVRVVW